MTVQASTEDSWAVERGLQLAAECIFDIGNHILSAHFAHSVEGYELILQALAERKVIDSQLQSDLAGFGGFRNILVHGDLELDRDGCETPTGADPLEVVEYFPDSGVP